MGSQVVKMDKLSLEHAKALIYGTGGNGRKLFEIIKKFCCVEGFIDKRAMSLKKMRMKLNRQSIEYMRS